MGRKPEWKPRSRNCRRERKYQVLGVVMTTVPPGRSAPQALDQHAGIGHQVDGFAADGGVVLAIQRQRCFQVMLDDLAVTAAGFGKLPQPHAVQFDAAPGRRVQVVAKPAGAARRVQHLLGGA